MNLIPLHRILPFAILLGTFHPVFAQTGEVDNPVPPCCSCVDLSNITITQMDSGNQSLMHSWSSGSTGPESSSKSTSMPIKKDLLGKYKIVVVVPYNCQSAPEVELKDAKAQANLVGTNNGTDHPLQVTYDLVACQVVLPLTLRVRCSASSECLEVTLDSECKACQCPAGTSNLNGTVTEDGANGKYGGNLGVGTSYNGDATTSIEFGINATQTLQVADFHVNSSGGYTDITQNGIRSITTDSCQAQICGTSPVQIDLYLKDGGTFSTQRFRNISFVKNTNTNALTATTTDYNPDGSLLSASVQEWRHPDTGKWEYVTASGMKKTSLERITPTPPINFQRVERRKEFERPDGATGEADALVSDVQLTYELMGVQWWKIKEVIDPSGSALVTEWSYYLPGEVTGAGASTYGSGLLRWMRRYDGHEEYHYYEPNGHTVTEYSTSDTTFRTVQTTWAAPTSTVTESGPATQNTKSERTYATDSVTEKQYTSSTSYLTTVTSYSPSGAGFGGEPIKVNHADGTVTIWSYARDSVADSKTVTMCQGVGTTTNGITTVTDGRQTVSTYSGMGVLSEEMTTGVGTGNGVVIAHKRTTDSDWFGRPLTVQYSPNNYPWSEYFTYDCCGVLTETDKHGITTTYAHDLLQRVTSTTRLGITTSTVFEGLTTKTLRNTNEVSRVVRTLAGTYDESWGPSPDTGVLVKLSTTFTNYRNPGGAVNNLGTGIGRSTVTYAIQVSDDAGIFPSQTTLYYLDGRISKTSGDLSPGSVYTYGANTASVSYLSYGQPMETTVTTTDWAGRSTNVTKGTESTTHTYYDLSNDPSGSRGKLKSIVDADQVVTLYGYNPKGERIITALDLNGNWSIDKNGTDQITESTTVPATYSGYQVLTTTTVVYAINYSSTPTVVSTTHRSTNGLRSWTITPGVTGTTYTEISLGSLGFWTEQTIRPDGTKNVAYYTNGRLAEEDQLASSNTVISSTTYIYDSNGRVSWTYPSVGSSISTVYRSEISDAVSSTTGISPGATAYTYDHRGRRKTVDYPNTTAQDGTTLQNTITTCYYPDGSVKSVSGDQTYQTGYTYDYAGRMKTLTTYGTMSPATTFWIYSMTTGRLSSKLAAAGPMVSYTYTNAGRLKTCTWARGKHTRYDYRSGRRVATRYFTSASSDTGSNAGNDSDTGDVGITYTRTGQPYSMYTSSTWNLPATILGYSYDWISLQLSYESTSVDPDLTFTLDTNGVVVNWGSIAASFYRSIDHKTDTYLRNKGVRVSNGPTDIETSLVYHATEGRLQYVTAYAPNYSTSRIFSYTYQPGSNRRIETVTGPSHRVINTWNVYADSDTIMTKANKTLGNSNISTYVYGVNNLVQRSSVDTSGSAFTTEPDWNWSYNSRGELASARHLNTTAASRFYSFDGIGNRQRNRDGTYTDTGGTLTQYFADTAGTTPGANSINEYAKINTLLPSYDYDGNLTYGPLPVQPASNSYLSWDGANRLRSTFPGGMTNTTYYLHDALGRRIMKSTGYTGEVRTYFVYDGWNIVAEYTGANHYIGTPPAITLIRTYAWGTDVSGSGQGAGGVGGLLATYVATGSPTGFYCPTFDGNGNVSEYIYDYSGTVAAHFEYDPFGRTLVDTDTNNRFPLRFSTKYRDVETGLYYYGYRYFDPLTGRWMSKDPIGERGGVNLYGFVGNDGVATIDTLGLTVEIFGNEGSGKNRADTAFSLMDNFKRFISNKYSASINIHVDVFAGTNHAHTGADIREVARKLNSNNEYRKVFIFVNAHGQIVGENYLNETVTAKERATKGHYIAMDSDVLTIPLNSELKLLNPEKIITRIHACFNVPYYRHKRTGVLIAYPDGMGMEGPLYKELDMSQAFYKTAGYGDTTAFEGIMNNLVDVPKSGKCSYAVAIFLGRYANASATEKGYQ